MHNATSSRHPTHTRRGCGKLRNDRLLINILGTRALSTVKHAPDKYEQTGILRTMYNNDIPLQALAALCLSAVLLAVLLPNWFHYAGEPRVHP